MVVGAALMIAGAAHGADELTVDVNDRGQVLAFYNQIPGKQAIAEKDWDVADAGCAAMLGPEFKSLGFSSLGFNHICFPVPVQKPVAVAMCAAVSRALVRFDEAKQIVTCSQIVAGKQSA